MPVQIAKAVNLQMIRPYFHILADYHHYCQSLPEHWTYSNYTLQNFSIFKLFFLNCRYLDVSFSKILLLNFSLFLSNIKIFSWKCVYYFHNIRKSDWQKKIMSVYLAVGFNFFMSWRYCCSMVKIEQHLIGHVGWIKKLRKWLPEKY